MNFEKNNLNLSTSPYLRQHQDNPIAWQEYSEEVVQYAQSKVLPLFISIGYATCHWCHVMANDTFSNTDVAEYMNENFICIKVDREQRPDIDSYCMNFIQANYGQGGWPLNVVMTPDLKPFFATTYLASTPRGGMPGFVEAMTQVLDFYKENKNKLSTFELQSPQESTLDSVDLEQYIQQFDKENGGFVANAKFPPHCSLLFLLSNEEAMANPQISSWAKNSLDIMQNSGLHDHVGGGFYRYCVDPKWEIPHFEKMLYDQAMMLISYSLGYAIFKDDTYKETISRILFSLEDTFKINDLYASGHDADTNHEEGLTYLWTKSELEQELGGNFKSFLKDYELIEFEGSNHLQGKHSSTLAYQLYETRKQREQPTIDTKILTSWNSLLGIAFCFVERFTEISTPVDELYNALLKQKDVRSSNNGEKQNDFFLEDAASILLFQTYMFERGLTTKDELSNQYATLQTFQKDDNWIENPNSDFTEINAPEFDHPIPSTFSLLEWALTRYSIIAGTETENLSYKMPLNFDAHNYSADFALNHSHFKSRELPKDAPLLSIIEPSDENLVCHGGACRPIEQ
jgi:uncharacterized protein YyaL (SSP411 family)